MSETTALQIGIKCILVSLATFVAVPGVAHANANKGLRAGAATTTITPPIGVSFDGAMSRLGKVKHVHDELHARALVLDDGEKQIAIVLCDLTVLARDICDAAKALVHTRNRFPTHHILIATTHTHAAPRVWNTEKDALDEEYRRFLTRRIADSVSLAVNNLSPAKIAWGVVDQPEFVRNRRWFLPKDVELEDPFGKSGDRVWTNASAKFKDKPAGPVDPQLFVVSVQHADGRPLALLGNYSTHYVGGHLPGHVSADYFGYFDLRLRELLKARGQDPPFVGMMSNGSSGDVNMGAGHRAKPPWSRMREVADDLAKKAIAVAHHAHHADITFAVEEAELELSVRRPDEERLAWAAKLWEQALVHRKQGKRLSRPESYARETRYLKSFATRSKIKLQAIRIGRSDGSSMAITAVPCEVFAETGLWIKQKSPIQPVFTISLANGYSGYLPTPQQHAWGGYETWPARWSYLEVRAEPKIRQRLMDLLTAVSK